MTICASSKPSPGRRLCRSKTLRKFRCARAQLKAQIHDLRIEIDEIKRSKQVEEIVDTDYFQHLSAQAKKLRAGRSGATEA